MAAGAPGPDDGAVVAALGRPETFDEAADRKAEASRLRRSRQTVLNLTLSLAASLGVVLFLVLVVVRPDQPPRDAIDYAQVAADAQPTTDEPLIVPALPDDWTANHAALERGSDGVAAWYVGFVTPKTQFVALTQGVGANSTWLDARLRNAQANGELSVEGVPWLLYSQRDDKDAGNLAFAMTTMAGDSTIILSGTATDEEFVAMATSIADDIMELSE